MMEYEWNRGGCWAGKPWTPDLPTDTALMLYVFAAFLAAPQWLFPQVPPAWDAGGAPRRPCLPHARCRAVQSDDVSSIGGTLCLGKVPARAAGGYLGVLPTRPPAAHKVMGGCLPATMGSQLYRSVSCRSLTHALASRWARPRAGNRGGGVAARDAAASHVAAHQRRASVHRLGLQRALPGAAGIPPPRGARGRRQPRRTQPGPLPPQLGAQGHQAQLPQHRQRQAPAESLHGLERRGCCCCASRPRCKL